MIEAAWREPAAGGDANCADDATAGGHLALILLGFSIGIDIARLLVHGPQRFQEWPVV
jgi:hypothetical protein